MNYLWSILMLALPTSIKIVYDLVTIKQENKSINHRSELGFTLAFGLFLSVLNALIFPAPDSPFVVNELRGGAMCAAIFFLFFDMVMGIALHGKPFYVNQGKDASKWDLAVAKMGPLAISFLRFFAGVCASFFYFNYNPY